MDTAPTDDEAVNLSEIGRRLLDRVDELCVETCRVIRGHVAAYSDTTLVTDEDLFAAVRAQALFIFEALGSDEPDTAPASRVGRSRAERGVPLADVMSAYRTGSQSMWEQLAQAVDDAGLTRRELRVAASASWQNQARYTDAMAEAYREVVTEQLIRRDQERSALVSGLIDGRLPAHITAWDATRLLGLPESGHLVVVAVGLGTADYRPSRDIEQVLSDEDFPSAWRLEPDMQVGVVALSPPVDLTRLGQILGSHATHRIGISPVYEGHLPPGTALNYAKAALLATTADDPIVVFDTNPYAVAAVTDPQTMQRYSALVLGAVNHLEPADKRVLIDTFRTWVDCGGSIPETARELFCHPNTVRYRLRRLKQYTGRDAALPRDVAELHLAVEADQRLRPPGH